MCRMKRLDTRPWISLILPLLLLFGCAPNAIDINDTTAQRHVLPPAARERPASPPVPVDLTTISSVKIDRQEEVVQIAVTGSQPFSYSMTNHDNPLRIMVDIQQARFVDLPPALPVGEGGVKAIYLRQVPGQEATARLEIHLEEQTAYSVAKEQGRLFVRIRHSEDTAAPAAIAALPQPAPPVAPPASQDYRVGPKDVLDITVYDEPDLSKKLRVSGNGSISFPLIGKIQVQHLSTTEIEEHIERMLSPRYLLHPQVSVQVAEFESQKVFIVGAIDAPINFTLRGKTTLLELLSQTGRLGRGEGGGQSGFLVVFRHIATEDGQGKPLRKEVQPIRIDLDRLLRQGDMTLNLVLQPHDVIYVPEPDMVFVFGQVNSPGPVPLSEGGMTLVEAISKAGGFTKVAAPSRTKVLRMVDGKEHRIGVNVSSIIKRGNRSKDIELKPDDIVVVPERLF